MTSAAASLGAILKWKTNAVAEVKSIGKVGGSRGTIDVSSYSSTDFWKEFIGGWKEGTELTLRCNWISGDTDGQETMWTDYGTGAVGEVIISDAGPSFTLTFNAIITNIGIEPPLEGVWEFECTLKPSGPIALGTTLCTAPASVVITGNVTGVISPVPAYAAARYSLTAVGSGDASVTITPTAGGATWIKVNGTVVASGAASGAITLTASTVTKITVDVHETGKVDRIYTIYVGKA
jgi:predicted secreted protein